MVSKEKSGIRLFTGAIVIGAIKDSFKKMNPVVQVKNPVIFIVGIGALVSTIVFFIDLAGETILHSTCKYPSGYGLQFYLPIFQRLLLKEGVKHRLTA